MGKVIKVRLAERLIRRWTVKAKEILTDEGYAINIDNIINAIDTELSKFPLSETDKKDIKKVYESMNI